METLTTSDSSTEAGLKTRHVFLDTEVYRRYGHNLNDKVLQTLLKLTKDHVCTLHVTDITLSEIERQLRDIAVEAAQLVNKSHRQLRSWQVLKPTSGSRHELPSDIDATALSQNAIRQFQYMMTVEWQPTRHNATHTFAEPVFQAYFRGDPPFDKPDSKEFPDAFIVATLNAWCLKNDQKMYVITKDQAMLRAVEQTKTLIPTSTLEDYLALRVMNPKTIEAVAKILKSSAWEVVEERVRDQAGNLGTVYTGSLQSGEIIDHQIGNDAIDLIDFDIISTSDGQIEVVAKVIAPIDFEVQYLDTSTASWDSEDHEYIGGEREIEDFDKKVTLSLLLTIDPQGRTVEDADILTREIYLEEPYEDFK